MRSLTFLLQSELAFLLTLLALALDASRRSDLFKRTALVAALLNCARVLLLTLAALPSAEAAVAPLQLCISASVCASSAAIDALLVLQLALVLAVLLARAVRGRAVLLSAALAIQSDDAEPSEEAA